jgi:hypothetical protein
MHPASSRPSRSNIKLKLGPISLLVDVYGGTYTPPSRSRACLGQDGAEHDPTKLKSLGQVCPVCDNLDGRIEPAVALEGKLVVVDKAAEVEALEASEAHRDEMPLVPIAYAAYRDAVLESSDVYWLAPAGGKTDELYTALAQEIELNDRLIVTRWASRKNVNLYRVVGRGGLLGLIKLLPGAELRAAPVDPAPLEGTAYVQATALVQSILDATPALAGDDVVSLMENPHRDTLELAAAEGEGKAVRVLKQNRTTFSDNLASASLAATLQALEDELDD